MIRRVVNFRSKRLSNYDSYTFSIQRIGNLDLGPCINLGFYKFKQLSFFNTPVSDG
jgi:hypothetical protein